MLSESCNTETPFFRFQVIHDGNEFLYYPEFKLYERPYLVLESNFSIGVDTLTFSTDDNLINTALITAGCTIEFIDTGDSYVVTEKDVVGGETVLILDDSLSEEHYTNDVLVVKSLKYESTEYSNIMVDDATSISPFKFKFIDIENLTAKDYAVSQSANISTTSSTLTNADTDSITDLWGDDKIVSISNNIDISESSIVLNADLEITDTDVEFTADISDILDVNSYFTLSDGDNVEIVKVTEVISTTQVSVNRGQLDTSASAFSSSTTDVYMPKYVYFWMIPFNKYIDYRYLVFRNIDFVLTWV